MSLVKVYSVFCDGRPDGTHAPGCPTWTAQELSSRSARATAKARGWQRIPNGTPTGAADRSPQCRVDR